MPIDYDLETDIRYLQGIKARRDSVLSENETIAMPASGKRQKGWSIGLPSGYDSEYIVKKK